MIDLYLTDPHVHAAIDEHAESCVGYGFELTGKDNVALEYAKDWCEINDQDGMNQVLTRELFATGNCILEMIDPPPELKKLRHLPIFSFTKIKANAQGNAISYTQKIDSLKATFENGTLNRLIHMQWNPIDNPLIGRGLLEPLLRDGIGYTWKDTSGTIHTENRPSYREIIEENEDSARLILQRYVPRHVYTFVGVSEDEVTAWAKKIRNLRPSDDIILGLTGKPKSETFEVTRVETDPRSRLHPFFHYFNNAWMTALETPTLRLFLEAGFTEASARTAVQILDRKHEAFRRFFKRRIEQQILKPYVMQQMDWTDDKQWREAEIRLEWNKPPPIELPERGGRKVQPQIQSKPEQNDDNDNGE